MKKNMNATNKRLAEINESVYEDTNLSSEIIDKIVDLGFTIKDEDYGDTDGLWVFNYKNTPYSLWIKENGTGGFRLNLCERDEDSIRDVDTPGLTNFAMPNRICSAVAEYVNFIEQEISLDKIIEQSKDNEPLIKETQPENIER